jgi:16S rRNA (cytosine967-C5)-methyltransferase
LIEIQDEGSQLISFLVNPRPGEVLVDACAGGGGKALHLAAMMKNSGVIHALELEERRFGDIRTRCSRNGVSIVRPAVANTEVLSGLRGTADAVLVDAPCTGSGTIRRNPLLRRTLSEGVLVDYVVRQREVLSAYAALVRPGGRLVYATCSLFSAENEGVVSWFLEKNARFHVVSARDVLAQSTIEIDGARTFLHILPQTTGADGFFAAVMVSA